MMRLIALAGFALAVATSAQAMPRATPGQAGSLTIQVRDRCGTGMALVNGLCVLRHDMRGAHATAANPGGNCYRAWDQDARQYKFMPCSGGSPAYVDTPGVRAIVRARERLGQGMWYPYAMSSGITCMPGTKVTMGGQEYLCQ